MTRETLGYPGVPGPDWLQHSRTLWPQHGSGRVSLQGTDPLSHSERVPGSSEMSLVMKPPDSTSISMLPPSPQMRPESGKYLIRTRLASDLSPRFVLAGTFAAQWNILVKALKV